MTFSIAYFSKKNVKGQFRNGNISTFANCILVCRTKKYFAILWSLIGLMTYDDVISYTYFAGK